LDTAKSFYADHYGKFFFQRLVLFMSSGESPVYVRYPCHLQQVYYSLTHLFHKAFCLEGEDAVKKWRSLIGPTHYLASRGTGTLRGKYATSDTRNAFHGSGSAEEAEQEIAFFQ
jgi:nucleoside-diphosphate kinase